MPLGEVLSCPSSVVSVWGVADQLKMLAPFELKENKELK